MYAIIQTGGKQYRVEEGQTVRVERLAADKGQQVELPVLALVDEGRVVTGSPTVEGAKVVGRVEGHGKNRKVLVFKYHAKVNYRRKTGHRQQYTSVRIEKIEAPA
ncbi:MAG TPA: 50S ribosomal protein L21 [Firmicutes bacterium]|nr:50S ribosomal protein L21 [Bacillota bacterium]